MRKSELAILAALADVLAIAEEAAKGSSARAKVAKGSLAMTLRSHAALLPAIERYRRLRAWRGWDAESVTPDDDYWLRGAMATGLDVADVDAGCTVATMVRGRGQLFWAVRKSDGATRITAVSVE